MTKCTTKGDLPPEEEMRMNYERSFHKPKHVIFSLVYGYVPDGKVIAESGREALGYQAGWEVWQAALSSQAEQIRKLEEKNRVLNNALTFVTAEHNALQARIEEADGQEPVAWGANDPNEIVWHKQRPTYSVDAWEPLYTRPPITSQRELELLAVIEQMREELRYINEVSCGDCELVDVQDDTEAMAYINEHISEFLDKEGESLTPISETDPSSPAIL